MNRYLVLAVLESNRVDQVARSRLGMVFPRTEDIVVLRR